MDTKKNWIGIILQIALIAAFVGYYFSLYRGNQNNLSTYTNLILVYTCGISVFFNKQLKEDKVFHILAKLNGAFLIIWSLTLVVTLL